MLDLFRRAATYVEHSARREAGRSSGAAPDQIRDGREPQDRHSGAQQRGERVRRVSVLMGFAENIRKCSQSS